jgi:WD40 repeat protein
LDSAAAPTLIRKPERVYQARFSTAAGAVGFALARGAVAIHTLDTNSERLILHATPDGKPIAVKSIDFSPDGKLLAFGDAANPSKATVAVFDTLTQMKVMTEQSGIDRILFSPKGDYLVTMTSSGTAAVWDALKGEMIMRLPARERFTSVTFGRVGDAPHVIFGTERGKVFIYDLDVNHLRKRAQEIWIENHSRTLTADECRTYLHRDVCPALAWQ